MQISMKYQSLLSGKRKETEKYHQFVVCWIRLEAGKRLSAYDIIWTSM